MRENFTSGSVGRAPGNRCLYPEMPWTSWNIDSLTRCWACKNQSIKIVKDKDLTPCP